MANDTELWNQIQAGSTQAFNELYAIHWEKIYALFYWHLLDQESAKDLVQELFTDLWIKREQIHITTTAEGYLRVAARNRMLNYIRAQNTRKKHYHLAEKHAAPARSTVEDIYNERELRMAHQDEIVKLPPKMKEVYTLVKEEGLSITQAAMRLSVSEQTIKNQLVTALKKIRSRLESYRE